MKAFSLSVSHLAWLGTERDLSVKSQFNRVREVLTVRENEPESYTERCGNDSFNEEDPEQCRLAG